MSRLPLIETSNAPTSAEPAGPIPRCRSDAPTGSNVHDSLLCIALMMVVTLFYQQVLLRCYMAATN